MATVKLSLPQPQMSTFRISAVPKRRLQIVEDSEDDTEETEEEEEENEEGEEDGECSSTFELTLPSSTKATTTTDASSTSRKSSFGEDENKANCCNNDEEYVPKKAPLSTDSNLSNYEKICTLGTGTFGRVYLMRYRGTDDYYALKLMPIHDVVRTKQVDHVHNEKQILESLDHPFIVKMHWTFYDQKSLYILFDYLPGGELFSYLRCEHRFSNETAKFYAAEIVLALEYLHNNEIVYRDLKPENLLLDVEGHVVITDFGFAKVLQGTRTYTMCGTPEYLAPEVIEGKGHNSAVDWWSFGILIYELLTGGPPFSANNPLKIYEQILQCHLTFPNCFNEAAKDLVSKLLMIDRTKRLGNMKGRAKDVKDHEWFDDINWADMADKKIEPPIIPKVNYEGDSGNFDEYDEIELNDFKEANVYELKYFEDW